MIELDEFKAKLKTYEQPLEEMRSSLDLENKERRIEELERTMAEPSFWDNPEQSQKIMKDLGSLKDDVATYSRLRSQYE